MPFDPEVIRDGFAVIERRAGHLTTYFFAHLFANHPELRALFPAQLDEQRDRVFGALDQLVARLDRPEQLAGYLAALGRSHRKFHARPEHYPPVVASFMAALRQCSGHYWTPGLERAWAGAFAYFTEQMIAGADQEACSLPAWWDAEVLDRRRAAADVTVLTLAPDRPYPYLAGQYLSLSSARLPRVWRPYSIACAPRADGTLKLHIRRVPGGLLSPTLVNDVMAGERLRLGAPAGDGVLDPDSARPFLGVAGGTGWGQLKALAEQLAADGGRPATIYAAFRSEQDDYDRAAIERLAAQHPWLELRPVLPPPGADRAAAIELLRRRLWEHGNCTGLDIHLSGPPDLAPALTGQLTAQGAEPELIRYDPVPQPGAGGKVLTSSEWFLDRREVIWINPAELGGE